MRRGRCVMGDSMRARRLGDMARRAWNDFAEAAVISTALLNFVERNWKRQRVWGSCQIV